MNTSHGRATHEHRLSDLTTSDVAAMDFEKVHYETRTDRRGTRAWGDREPGNRLFSHAKGVGITKALKRLLPSS